MKPTTTPNKHVEMVRRDTAVLRTSNSKSTAQENALLSSGAVAPSTTTHKYTADSYGFDFGRPEWHRHGLCRGRTDEFFAQQITKSKKDELVAICQQCTVRSQCLESTMSFVIDNDGIFGGLTPAERKTLRYQRMQNVVGETA